MGRVILAAGLAILAMVVIACTSSGSPPAPTRPASPAAELGAPAGMPIVTLDALPTEAAATIAAIQADGPYAYRQDGATFENREGHLPAAPKGFYREYTVPTPGEDDRGARRIVTGADGSMYWTADHYDSFAWIAR